MLAGVDADCTVSLFRETAPPVGANPRLHPRNSTNLSIRSSRTILSSLSRRLVIHFTHPHRTHPVASTSPRRIAQEGWVRSSNTLRLSSSALFGFRLATRFYDASSLFSVSGLRLFRCCDLVFVSICATTSTPCPARLCSPHRLSLLPTRRAIIKHTPLFFALLD